MHSPLVRILSERHALPFLDAETLDDFLAAAPNALLFFAGDARQRMESDDVAVALPELLKAFGGRLRGGIIARDAEEKLKARFHVVVMPSLAVTRGAETLEVIAKIRDWSEYVARIGAALQPGAPVLTAGEGPQTNFRIGGAKVDA